MGHQIVISPDSPFTVDNIPFGVFKTAKDSIPRCASAIGDYAIDLSLYAQRGNLDNIGENLDLVDVFGQVRPSTRGVSIAVDPRDMPQLV
jgi:fumarylacetoacetase